MAIQHSLTNSPYNLKRSLLLFQISLGQQRQQNSSPNILPGRGFFRQVIVVAYTTQQNR